MAYALIYTAKSSGKTSYWANPGFTGNSKRKYTWEKPGEIHFAQLKQQYPTLFGNKSTDRFEILNLATGQKQPVATSPAPNYQVKRKPTQPTPQSLTAHPKMFRKTPYLIVLDSPNQARRYWSNSQKNFIKLINDRLSRWADLATACESLKWLLSNDQFKEQFTKGKVTILNGQTGEAVLSPAEVAKLATSVKAAQTLPIQAAKQGQRAANQTPAQRALDQHFGQLPTEADLRDDTALPDELPGIDLAKYDPALVFGAASYLIDALKERKTVNQLLKKYDGAILQDYLHVLEFVGLADLDIQDFTSAFQANRQERRQIKNLSLLLNALAQAFDPDKFWAALKDDSASNQYHFRSASTAKQLQAMIKSFQQGTADRPNE